MEFLHKWWPSILYIFEGATINLKYTIVSVFLGLIFGTLIAIAKIVKYKPLNFFANTYTSIFRGTPLIIQLSIIYYVVPSIIPVKFSIFTAGVIAFSLNSSAYVSEIVRSGINAVDKGQYDACHVLGLPKFYMYKDIILPQAVRKILPSLVNELINMLKETAIISIIGESDVLRRANLIAQENYNFVVPMMSAAIAYYFMVLILSNIASYLEKKIAI